MEKSEHLSQKIIVCYHFCQCSKWALVAQKHLEMMKSSSKKLKVFESRVCKDTFQLRTNYES